MSEQKQQRQTTLFSFFSQPSKKKKKDDETSTKKSQETPMKKKELTSRRDIKSNSEVGGVSQPTVTQERVVVPAVSPMEQAKTTPINRGANIRKRPRPKSTNDVENNHDPQPQQRQHQEALLLLGKSKVPLRESMDDQMNEKIVNNYQQPGVASGTPAKIPMPNEDQGDENEGLSSDDDSKSDLVEADGISAYELLRQRNIERNNARLASLGLLSPNMEPSTSQPKKPRRQRKTPSRATKTAPSIPTRRSTRTRRSVLSGSSETTDSTLNNTTLELSTCDAVYEPVVKEQEEEEEIYTVSPLVQYAMSSSEASTTTMKSSVNGSTLATDSKGSTTTIIGRKRSSSSYSLHPMGPRLAPPKGLKAIYSLDFFEPSYHSSSSSSSTSSWLVGAGKAGIVALWDCRSHAWNNNNNNKDNQEGADMMIDPTLTWKAHNGRWIAEARFLPNNNNDVSSSSSTMAPSRLLTAANDGKVCLWDLSTVSVRSGVPKLLSQSGGDLHKSGIFAMDVLATTNQQANIITIATGSKDKTVAVSVLDHRGGGGDLSTIRPIWKSNVHTAKVGAVRLHPTRPSILASASDDNLVCVHDTKCGEQKQGVVVRLEDYHNRPHSVVWDPYHSDCFMTAGLDKEIKLWDIRSTKEPIVVLHGHVPENIPRCKRIHHPIFYYPQGNNGDSAFVLSGGERSQALSMFHHHYDTKEQQKQPKDTNNRLYSRGKLPVDCGDAGCIAVNNDKVAVSVQDGEILILSPSLEKQ